MHIAFPCDAQQAAEFGQRVGMVIHPQYSRADLVDRTITTVEHNLGEGALLVALVLLYVVAAAVTAAW